MMRFMSIQSGYQRKGMLMLAWLALLICLISTSTIHHHESGIHQVHACQLCALEELTAHGAAFSSSTIIVVELGILALNNILHRMTSSISYFTCDIRGSPVFS